MTFDSYEIPDGHEVVTDLCIIGGGMVGIAMARELKRGGLGVVVLESGGTDFDGPSQALYQGTGALSEESSSSRNIDDYLVSSRFRQFGGSGHKWGGKCGIPDEEVFEERSWIPNSGWPFTRANLMPFYDQACDVLGIKRFGYDEGETQDASHPVLSVSGKERITTSTRHISPVTGRLPERSAFEEYLNGVKGDASIDLYLHANVVDMLMNEAGNAISSVKVATLQKNTFTVRAKQFVLATGGIENARLLLLANQRQPEGIGNQHGLVGRYFSGHLTYGSNSLVYFTNLSQSLLHYIGRNMEYPWAVLKTAKELQAEHRLPNATLSLNPGRIKPSKYDEAIMKSAYLTDGRMNSPDLNAFAAKGSFVSGYFMSEEAPNAASRITLSDERDSLGLRRVHLDWQFTSGDVDAIVKSGELFARELGAAGLGRMKPNLNRRSVLGSAGISRHHIGSTRMHADPKRGVVDTDCKVHDVDNLYIAGSSVFPSAGIVNPTLTIIALGLKLCGHLRGRL